MAHSLRVSVPGGCNERCHVPQRSECAIPVGPDHRRGRPPKDASGLSEARPPVRDFPPRLRRRRECPHQHLHHGTGARAARFNPRGDRPLETGPGDVRLPLCDHDRRVHRRRDDRRNHVAQGLLPLHDERIPEFVRVLRLHHGRDDRHDPRLARSGRPSESDNHLVRAILSIHQRIRGRDADPVRAVSVHRPHAADESGRRGPPGHVPRHLRDFRLRNRRAAVRDPPAELRRGPRAPGFIVEMALVGLIAFAVREKSFLQELIVPEAEAHLLTKPTYSLDRGYTYAVLERDASQAFEIFKDFVTHGTQGLCITRRAPKAVMTEYGLERTPILWLSRVATEKNAVRPSPPEKVALAVEHFIEVSEHPVVLLDGLEYLVSHNDFGSVLALLHDLNESVAMREAILLVPFDPTAFNEREIALVRREVRLLGPLAEEFGPVAKVSR